jgi:hypothetical protein
MWIVSTNSVPHTVALALERGVPRSLREEILIKHRSGAGPQKILNLLKGDIIDKDNVEVQSLTRSRVRNFCRWASNNASGRFIIHTRADLQEWASSRLIPKDVDQVKAMERDQLFVLKDGFPAGADGFA